MSFDAATDQLVSALLLGLRMRAPFFATLALFARFRPSDVDLPTATDGRDIFINPYRLHELPREQQEGFLLHTLLHAALLHLARRGVRDRQVWNMAADIVVNGIITTQSGCVVPQNSPRDTALEHLAVEEVYELLLLSPERQPPPGGIDLLDTLTLTASDDHESQGDSDHGDGRMSHAALEAYWHNALQQATVVVQAMQRGSAHGGMAHELAMLDPARMDWRTLLWRYLTQTPTDFSGFDRRFIGQRLYLETLAGETVHVFVAVDTSGSVNDAAIRQLVSEVQSMLSAYPHLSCELYYADDTLYGPYTLAADTPLPPPQGGGGTDFAPFFADVTHRITPYDHAVCVYLTDGFGAPPAAPPPCDTLWVLIPGGCELDALPFGEGVRMIDSKR